jgi:hypothetical protein
MPNGRRLLVLSSCLAILVAVAPAPAVAKRGGTDRPLHGAGAGTSTVDLATGIATSQGTARFSHLGKTTFALSAQVTITGPNTIALSGAGTFVAANGDELHTTLTGTGTFTGIGPPSTAHYTLVLTVTGGTGRFADASGTITASVDQEDVSQTGTIIGTRETFTAEGTLSY